MCGRVVEDGWEGDGRKVEKSRKIVKNGGMEIEKIGKRINKM